MATVHCCLSITSSATPTPPASQDPLNTSSSEQSFGTRPPTRIPLPNGKPLKWSTGVAPRDYGGPPTTSKLRKYWGGDEDPLASDDYLWNKDFMDRMKKLIRDSDDDGSDPSVQSAKNKECSRTCESKFCEVPPFLRYGKYCGILYSGCPGEQPCDRLDACCLRHDQCIQLKGTCHHMFNQCDRWPMIRFSKWMHQEHYYVGRGMYERASDFINIMKRVR